MVDLVVLVGFLLMFLIGVIWSLLIKKSLFWGAIIDGALIGFIALWIGLVVVRFATEQQVHGGLVFAVGVAAFVAAWSVYALFAKAQNASFVATHGVGFVIGVLAFVLSGFLHFQPTPKPIEPVKQVRELTQTEQEKKAFDDASYKAYRDLTRQIKSRLHDPKSYEEVSVHHFQFDGKIRIRMQFRAKNAFGALMLQSALAEADRDGGNVRIIEVN